MIANSVISLRRLSAGFDRHFLPDTRGAARRGEVRVFEWRRLRFSASFLADVCGWMRAYLPKETNCQSVRGRVFNRSDNNQQEYQPQEPTDFDKLGDGASEREVKGSDDHVDPKYCFCGANQHAAGKKNLCDQATRKQQQHQALLRNPLTDSGCSAIYCDMSKPNGHYERAGLKDCIHSQQGIQRLGASASLGPVDDGVSTNRKRFELGKYLRTRPCASDSPAKSPSKRMPHG